MTTEEIAAVAIVYAGLGILAITALIVLPALWSVRRDNRRHAAYLAQREAAPDELLDRQWGEW